MKLGCALAIAVISLALVGPAKADPGDIGASERALLSQTCSHYVNRARFKERDGSPEFVVVLADSCSSAVRSLDADNRRERVAAVVFLRRLRHLRDTIIDMNMQRVFGAEYGPFTRIGGGKAARTEPVARVSASGEYLIAHRMGLLHAYRAWLDTGPEFASGLQPKG